MAGVLHADDKETVDNIGLDRERAFPLDCLDAIPNEILQYLAHETVIEPKLRAGLHQTRFNCHRGRRLEVLNQLANDSVHTAAFQLWFGKSGKLQVLADDVVQPIELSQNGADEASRLFIGFLQFVFKQLHVERDGAERIPYFMRNL